MFTETFKNALKWEKYESEQEKKVVDMSEE